MATVTTVTTQPGVAMSQAAPQNIRDWSSSLCNCCADGCKAFCCYVFCLPCMLCTMTSKMNESCCVCCLPYGLVAMRTKLRTMYGITGSICKDYCAYCWCTPCMICQMDREMTHVGL